MNIVVVGAGAIGKERIKALRLLGENIVAVIDPYDIPKELKDWDYLQYPNLESYFECNNDRIDWMFVCTPHENICSYVNYGLSKGWNILAEKPLGRKLEEVKGMKFKNTFVGFNYRFYKGVAQLLKDCKEKVFGDLISVSMTLALGDAPRTEKTWRLNPKPAGRGAILDPGIHLIDLMFQITDKPLKTHAFHSTDAFWKTGIEEECHLIASDGETIFNIQASKVRWRNEFKIQVNGTEGYGIVEGRNRNYGNQTYRRGKRWG
jgi:predicted dehydrogenase